jgi:FkbM family methyltransferase
MMTEESLLERKNMVSLMQIGCNDGGDGVFEVVSQSHYDFVLLVDANPLCIEKVKAKYEKIPNVHFDVAAVAGDNREATFYSLNTGNKANYSENSSLDKGHLIKQGYNMNQFTPVTVRCKTFADLMVENKLTELDKLFIDIEGLDFEVLMSINFKLYNISLITFEEFHMNNEQREAVRQRLKDNGYEVGGMDSFNTTATKQKS